jgi:hypothetical protein
LVGKLFLGGRLVISRKYKTKEDESFKGNVSNNTCHLSRLAAWCEAKSSTNIRSQQSVRPVLCLILCFPRTYLHLSTSRLLNFVPFSSFFPRFFNSTTFFKVLLDQHRDIRHFTSRRWITYSDTSSGEVSTPTQASVRLASLLQKNLHTRCQSGVLSFSLALPSSSS